MKPASRSYTIEKFNFDVSLHGWKPTWFCWAECNSSLVLGQHLHSLR